MTTYTLPGVVRRGTGASETLTSTEIELVLPDAVTSFRYRLDGTEDGLPIYTVFFETARGTSVQSYALELDEAPIGDNSLNIFVQINSGPFAGSVLFDSFDLDEDADYLFAVSDGLPDLSTVAGRTAFASFFGSVSPEDVLELPTGDYAPGESIALADLPGVSIAQADVLEGTGASDSFNVGKGNDQVWGRGGNDDIEGGSGNDKIYGDAGNDTLDGGSGKDSLFGGNGKDQLSGGGGLDKLDGGGSTDTLRGGSGKDTLKGAAGNDHLYGDGGNDSLNGGAGKDALSGGNNNDTLTGGNGKDTLKGGGGRDKLYGERGNDTLEGGNGADLFVFAKNGGHDTISDFKDNVDTLGIDNNVLSGKVTKGRIMDRAEQVDDDVVITFNAKTSVTILDFDLGDLRNDLNIV